MCMYMYTYTYMYVYMYMSVHIPTIAGVVVRTFFGFSEDEYVSC